MAIDPRVQSGLVERLLTWGVERGDDIVVDRALALFGRAMTPLAGSYDAEHEMIEDLKRKDHIAVADVDPKLLTSPDLVRDLAARFRAAMPYMRFQATALGLPA